ncbi:nSTAND1 domain-containing NTPase [Nakamurella multipartita]|uniref:Transcriptional regulator, SARP family n=1 Tax=Nakamurella multipartita (strain ATCC 700099 / DSM 44233 / CIP 104796 / JCM 9543 / NBRC 105858 / Y-104) TaxID=479431 RepID=C8X9U2_NAKMY|nr:BTAD domain-containing putative transcriptional regulator [Nakamurella multipartita]ACV79250.1 transcriptional regulator, SARP family [Nakamurella multipartita DSM 44233]
MVVVEIAALGPLEIRGQAATLSPRDRTVLCALALTAGHVMSAERLADALWGESAPPSWHKVVPGCVMRLRRLLGTEAIETMTPGYRLTVVPEDIDLFRFERLLGRGRELLLLGEPERAGYALDEALGLWRGAPLSDLGDWEPGRIEADRLDELHLQAQECRIEAALRSGRAVEMIADAHRRVAEAPLRERRWALLAQAQYQAGQQAQALRTLRRARSVLASELGLDPGADLLALEAAILRQDPALDIRSADVTAAADCPWPGLVPYGISDVDSFFGRDREITECLDRLATTRILVITGPSGSGKSSLVRAGLAARFARGGHPVVITPGADPLAAVGPEPLPAGELLVVDQAEELFTLTTDPDARSQFLARLIRHHDRGPLVMVLRADRVGDLAAFPDFARLAERELYLLGPLTDAGLRAAIEGPARQAGLLLEPGLVDLLVRDVEGEPGALPLLSHVLQRTWQSREGRILTVAGYRASGGIRGSVAQAAEQLYQSLAPTQQGQLRHLLLRLVSTTDDNDAVRIRVPRPMLAGDRDRERLLEVLTDARLVTIDRDSVELSHECLARVWPRLRGWLDDDVEGRRILRHLAGAAQTWDGMGRVDSELYRGVRLSQALAWAENNDPDLTATERDFLAAAGRAREADIRAAEQAAHARARNRRRGRLIAGATTALLVVALVAAFVAVRQQQARDAADLAALISDANRVDDASRSATGLDQALLYAVQAVRVHDAPETRNTLLALLSQHPDLIRSVRTGPVQSLETTPDGTGIVVGTDTSTDVYDVAGDRLDHYHHLAAGSSAAEVSPDNRKIVLVASSSSGFAEASAALSAKVVDAATGADEPLTLPGVAGHWVYGADVSYSGDGRRLAAYAGSSDLIGLRASDLRRRVG